MIKIRSREQAIEELGKMGAHRWDNGYGPLLGYDYDFVYPKPLEPLTDEELGDIYLGHMGTGDESIRAAVEAHDERNAAIEQANPKPLEWRTDKAPDEYVAVPFGDGRPMVARGSNLYPGSKWYPLPQGAK